MTPQNLTFGASYILIQKSAYIPKKSYYQYLGKGPFGHCFKGAHGAIFLGENRLKDFEIVKLAISVTY